MQLRDYQKEASNRVMEEFGSNNSTLLVLPTGGGKTVVFADIINRFRPGKAIVIAHREELIFQAQKTIEKITGLRASIEMGGMTVQPSMFEQTQVLVSTVQTQVSKGANGKPRMTRFDPMEYALLIIDECHHSTASTFRKLIDYYRQNPDLRVLGVTATPDRTDEQALGQIFDTVAFDYEIVDAINDGWLVPITQRLISIEGLDFSKVRTTAGDLNGADLDKLMKSERNLQGVAGATLEIIGKRRTLVFAASLAHAEMLAEIFNRHTKNCAAWVSGKTPKDDRRRILSDFGSGKIQILVNVGVATEGYDNPAVEVIVMGRPTKSRALYAQCIGRATRPLPGLVEQCTAGPFRKVAIRDSAKPFCEILDFVGNSGRHKLITAVDILGGKISDDVVEKAIEKIKKSKTSINVTDAIKDAEQEQKLEADKKRLEESARRAKLIADVRFNSKEISPFDVFNLAPVSGRGWDTGKSLSEKQTALLIKQGIDPHSMDLTQAKHVIGEICKRFNGSLCTYKQAKLLLKHGYDPANVTMKDATNLINRIAENGWNRPDPEPDGGKPKSKFTYQTRERPKN